MPKAIILLIRVLEDVPNVGASLEITTTRVHEVIVVGREGFSYSLFRRIGACVSLLRLGMSTLYECKDVLNITLDNIWLCTYSIGC